MPAKIHFDERQNKLILAGELPNSVLAQRMGVTVRQVQRQRALLKEKGNA